MALVHFSTQISHICLCAYYVIDGDWLLVRSLEQEGVRKANPLSVSWDLAIDFFPLPFTEGPTAYVHFFLPVLLTWRGTPGDFWSGRFNGYGWHFVKDFYSVRWTFYYYSSFPFFLPIVGQWSLEIFWRVSAKQIKWHFWGSFPGSCGVCKLFSEGEQWLYILLYEPSNHSIKL